VAQQRRGKTQARRSGGNGGGLPGWAWLVIGVALTLGVVLAAPKLFKSGDGGFFRPTPNPDAQPQPVDEEAVVDTEGDAPQVAATEPEDEGGKATEYDFYRLLPGQEVPVSDAELAASEKAERERAQAANDAGAASADGAAPAGTPPAVPLPAPVEDPAAPTAPAPPTAPRPAPAPSSPASDAERTEPASPASADSTRYVLQAGAFEASGQAEELKARIAMLGLGARVESARIGGKTVYRVRMGPYGSATELAEAKRKLASGGLPGIAVKTN
jgi:cell division protein FtsN